MVMPFYFYSLVKLLHLIAMAFWLAAAVSMPGDTRRTLLLGRPHVDALVPRARRSIRIALASGLLTIATGGALVAAHGGLGGVSMRIQIGLVLTLVLFAVSAALVLPTWRRLSKLIEGGGDLQHALALSRKLTMYTGLEHLFRFSVLTLMVFRY
ncbi:hypothetical protein [Sorangium sp. So ce124]|uniref:hypothetical protein n=1 Tax=Sorangium sp. So ce124 TaxID=3133280 RepID=UPI003F61F5AE